MALQLDSIRAGASMVEVGGQSRNWLASPLIAGLMRLQLVLDTPFHGNSRLSLTDGKRYVDD